MKEPDRYHPDRERLAVADAVNRSLSNLLPFSRLHDQTEETAKVWSALEELGVFGVSLPEACGGSGLGLAEEVSIVMALGSRLVAPSVLATIGANVAGPDRFDAAHGLLGAAFGFHGPGGELCVVQDSRASLCLARDGEQAGLHRLDETGVQTIENSLWFDRLGHAGKLGRLVHAFSASQQLRLRLLDAAALSGIAEAALNLSVEYAKLRQQFGRPIGSFQAVKHHCANMAIAARQARDQTSFAAIALEDDRVDAPLQVESALVAAGAGALANANACVQIHGGIGFSDEAHPHILVKRAQVLLAAAGGIEAAIARIAEIEPA